MTAKNTSSTDQAQGALPFGAISDAGAATSGTAKKKVARKKTVKKKASKKKVAKKASSRRTKAAEPEEPSAASTPVADEAKPARSKTTKPKATKVAKPKATKTAKRKAPASKASATKDEAKPKEAPELPPAEPKRPPVGSNGAASTHTETARPKKGDVESGDTAPDRSDGQEGGDGEGKRRRTRRGRRRRRSGAGGDEAQGGDEPRREKPERGEDAPAQSAPAQEGEGSARSRRRRRRRGKKNFDAGDDRGQGQRDGQRAGQKQGQNQNQGQERARDSVADADAGEGEGRPSRSRKRGKGQDQGKGQGQGTADDAPPKTGSGMFILDKGNVSVLRQKANGYLPAKDDIYVSKNLVQKHKLRDGMMISGKLGRGYKHKFQLDTIEEIDGQPPEFWKFKPFFKDLTSIDPDFHYAVGDVTDEVSMRVVDLISPIGRGQRGLLVAPPRTGKTTIMRQFAAGIEKGYPDVHLMVLLIDERPEEATEWKRSVDKGEVFVSTADESSKHHIQVAELVWKRAMRLVEMGEDVVLLLDSITRLARAYNNQAGPGRTMSGGLDSRAMERPRKIFGSARNTVEAGSLTILGTTLIETGSKLDQMVFEEFKGTGNMELMLNRKLSDRRIFPAIDIARSGTRKEEKLVGMRRLKLIHVLRRVLARMHFTEAAELLITRLDDVEKTDDFLERFTVDPEA